MSIVRRSYFEGSYSWVDDVVIEQVLRGERPPRHPTVAERRILVEKLFHKGYTLRQTAEALGITTKSVSRWRQTLGLKKNE